MFFLSVGGGGVGGWGGCGWVGSQCTLKETLYSLFVHRHFA